MCSLQLSFIFLAFYNVQTYRRDKSILARWLPMKKISLACAATALLVFPYHGCLASTTQKTIPGVEAQFTNPARTITVSQGEKFVIIMESNRTTGFAWQLEKPVNENLIKVLGSEYMHPKSDLDGAGGKEIWTFRAVSVGEAKIHFKYVRPWEKGKPPEKQTVYTVVIR